MEQNSFSEVVDGWLSDGGLVVKPSSRSTYTNIVNAYLRPHFGDMAVTSITSERISSFLSARGECVAPSTLRGIASVLMGALEFARESGHELNLEKKKYTMPGVFRSESRVLSGDERARLERVLIGNDPCRMGTLISLYSGIRLGEICALQWENIDLGRGVLTVQRTVQRIKNCSGEGAKTLIHFDRPKSRSSMRSIPLPAFLVEMLRELEKPPRCYVLTGTEDFVEPRKLQSRFKKYLLEAEIESVNFHVLRHTFATRCVELGFDIKTLSRILGHSDVSTTLNIYVHPQMSVMREYMDRLNLS